MTAGPIGRAELVELIAEFESFFEDGEASNDGSFPPSFDNGELQAFGVDIESVGVPANPSFAEALGGRFICALDDGTCAAWGAPKPMPSGWVSRELVFYEPHQQTAP